MSRTPAAPAAKTGSRIAQFDAMRGMSVFAVMIVHCWWVQPESPISAAIRKMLPANFISVDMFFVISGYLITGILMRSLGTGHFFRTFYIRRALRILPAYYFCLLVLFFVLPRIDDQVRDSKILDYWWMYVLHIQNWLFSVVNTDLGWPGTYHWWTLAVEEQFYFVWPMLVLATRTPRRMAMACLAIIAASIACKIGVALAHGSWFLMHMSTPTRMDSLATGALIATFPREIAVRYARAALLAAIGAFAIILLLVATQPSDHSAPHTAAITALAAIVFGGMTLRVHTGVASSPLLRNRALIWMGEHSYGLYLIHLPLFFVMLTKLKPYMGALSWMPANARATLIFGLMMLITLPAAWALKRYLEMPMLELRHRLAPDPVRPSREVALETNVPAAASAERAG
ncbi:MAG TPA: acyltransferase [Nevskiaceae bacterium]|nr:acyltransferase [Nevskiaceae bacterium]